MDGPELLFTAPYFHWVLLANFVCALCLTGLARRVAPQIGFLDSPDAERKRQQRPVPLLGGIAIFVSFATFFSAACMFGSSPVWVQVGIPIVISAGLCCAVGLWDDRFGMKAGIKFLLTAAAVLPAALACAPQSASAFGIGIELGPFAVPLTVCWLIVCTHIVNLLDGLDGLAATLGLAAMVSLAIVSYAAGDFASVALTSLLFASIAGFLVYNWPPAKIYLGDAGSLSIGVLCGALSTSIFVTGDTARAVPIIGLLAIPIIDALFAIARRRLEGRSIACADSGHIHHCALSNGASKTRALLLISCLSLCISAAAIMSFFTGRDAITTIVAATVVFGLAGSGRFGRHELSLAWHAACKCLPLAKLPQPVGSNTNVARDTELA